jgi:citrate synthase
MMMTTTTTTSSSPTPSYSPGLEGVIAGPTNICTVNPQGTSLTYRGYDVKDLIDHCSFEEVAYLLIYGALPKPGQLLEFNQALVRERAVPEGVLQAISQFPAHTNPMDSLKAAVALLALQDPDKDENGHEANIRKAIRLTAKIPTVVAAAHRTQAHQPIIAPMGSELSLAENFLYMLLGNKPGPVVARVFNATLIIYAEHSFNASTFSARVTVSTLSDVYSGVLAAIGTLKGPLHGGANEQSMLTMLEIADPAKAEAWLRQALVDKRKIMGFGHREYKVGDPRATILTAMRQDLINELGEAPWPPMADAMQAVMLEKGLHPNVDFPIGYMYYMMGIPTHVYTPIFAVGRIAGWTAHIIEQLDNNRLIRPKALYEGPTDCVFVPLNQR